MENAIGRPGLPELQPTYEDVAREYTAKELQIRHPTTLILVDEADRLRMASLEQTRAILDAGKIGMISIGMLGQEKRLARYPQFYSRIGRYHPHHRRKLPATEPSAHAGGTNSGNNAAERIDQTCRGSDP